MLEFVLGIIYTVVLIGALAFVGYVLRKRKEQNRRCENCFHYNRAYAHCNRLNHYISSGFKCTAHVYEEDILE